MSTILRDVGLQVWRGALLMADYILHSGARFQGCNVLELGLEWGWSALWLHSMPSTYFAQVQCTSL